MEKKQIIFADGMSFYPPNEKAPDFVIGKIAVNIDKFTMFMAEHPGERGWISIDVKKSKGGNVYCELNTWKKPE